MITQNFEELPRRDDRDALKRPSVKQAGVAGNDEVRLSGHRRGREHKKLLISRPPLLAD
jgi:hypothetical protein